MASQASQNIEHSGKTPQYQKIADAVQQHGSTGKNSLFEKLFSHAFKGLVYAQIWEDPVVDMAALDIQHDSRMITIASGGCNVLSYLVAKPAHIVAVDLNTAHIALGKLKLAAAANLPDHQHFHRFFGKADDKANIAAYRQYIAPHLDETSRRYWEGRDLTLRKRIGGFGKGVYRRGLLGHFIAAAHLLAWLYKVEPKQLLQANSLSEQRQIFDQQMAPMFDRKFIRWLTNQPPSLFGLGIPPAQFDALAGDQQMADVLRQRLEKLACDFDIKDNYFAWQAFGRGYGKGEDMPLPPYLQHENYQIVRDMVDRVDMVHANFVEQLELRQDQSLDRYILLDAQDWMNDAQLTHLWREITRTARRGARVLFRTAAEPSLLPGRVPQDILDLWSYRADQSLEFTRRDRSSIYGGVHLYIYLYI